jgi:demethylmenaquinone methyltransferase / 2-methoxy-6-polyprenyl-1,4-benzoquinol methylase
MFDRIADRYDLLNRLMSLGLDKRWRRLCVRSLGETPHDRILDVATGTGDLAVEAVRQYPQSHVIGIDPSLEMLRIGRKKVNALGLSERIQLEEGDAQTIPHEDQSFDAVMVAFGIRNVPDRPRALAEFARVIRPGGTVSVLEISEPRGGIMAPLSRLWVDLVMPTLGGLLSGAHEYKYLKESMKRFPSPDEFEQLLLGVGLVPLSRQSFMFGACHLFVARRGSRVS